MKHSINYSHERLKQLYPDRPNSVVCEIFGLTNGQLRGLITRLQLKKSKKYFSQQQRVKSHKYHYPKKNRP